MTVNNNIYAKSIGKKSGTRQCSELLGLRTATSSRLDIKSCTECLHQTFCASANKTYSKMAHTEINAP